ncbi:hypothetical protein Tco_0052685 [Tanacetum coccineum]
MQLDGLLTNVSSEHDKILMAATRKLIFEHVQCLPKSKILTNSIKNHPLRFSIAASSSVPWIYMAQFWHTLKEDGSKYRLRLYNGTEDITCRDLYPIYKMDDIMKNIFNSRRHKDKVGMQIPDWMITEKMKHTEHYRMYAEVFGLDVPLTQSQLTESTQGTHRTPSAPRSPIPKKDTTESSAPKGSTVIRFRHPERRSTCLTPPVLVPNIEKADEMILQDTLQEYNITVDPPHNLDLLGLIIISYLPDTEKLQELTSYRDGYTYLFEHLKERFLSRKSFDTLADHLQEVMVESLPTMVDYDTLKVPSVKKKVPEAVQSCRRHTEYKAYVSGESCLDKSLKRKRDDDEIPSKQVSQDIMEEVSQTIDEAKLKKMADEMLRQRCTSGDEHQYHIDQMKNFLSDIVWESRSEHSCLSTSMRHTSWLEKIVLSLHKFPAIIFNDDDIEERKSRWVNKCVKKFNPYARYGVEY